MHRLRMSVHRQMRARQSLRPGRASRTRPALLAGVSLRAAGSSGRDKTQLPVTVATEEGHCGRATALAMTETVRVSHDSGFPPFAEIKDGKSEGLAVDILALLPLGPASI